MELTAEVVPLAKRSEEPTPAGTSLQFFPHRSNYTCERIPRDAPAANKPLFPLLLPTLSLRRSPPRGMRRGSIKRRKKRLLKPPVHLYQFFHHLFPNLFDRLLRYEEVKGVFQTSPRRTSRRCISSEGTCGVLCVSTRGGSSIQQPRRRLDIHVGRW